MDWLKTDITKMGHKDILIFVIDANNLILLGLKTIKIKFINKDRLTGLKIKIQQELMLKPLSANGIMKQKKHYNTISITGWNLKNINNF